MVPVRELYDRLEIEPAIETELRAAGVAGRLSAGGQYLPAGLAADARTLRCGARTNRARQACALRGRAGRRLGRCDGGRAGGVDALFGLRLAEAELIDCAAALGSDTAFSCATLLSSARAAAGDAAREAAFGGYTLLIVKPDEAVSTREAYAGVRPAVPAESLEESMRLPVTAWQGRVKNDFRTARLRRTSAVGGAQREFVEGGRRLCRDVGQRLGSFRIVRRSRAGAKLYPRLSTGYFSTGSGCRGLAAASVSQRVP